MDDLGLVPALQWLVDESRHVFAGRLPVVADVEDLADLGEREPGSLGVLDGLDTLDDLTVEGLPSNTGSGNDGGRSCRP